MEKITLDLFADEAAIIVQVIGNLPTQTGAFPLYQKLIQQIQAQMPAQEEAKEESAE